MPYFQKHCQKSFCRELQARAPRRCFSPIHWQPVPEGCTEDYSRGPCSCGGEHVHFLLPRLCADGAFVLVVVVVVVFVCPAHATPEMMPTYTTE